MATNALTNEEMKASVLGVFSTLVSDLDADRLSDYLIEGFILTVEQWQEILNKQLTKQGRCRELLTMLLNMKNPRTFLVFRDALERNSHWHWILGEIDKYHAGNNSNSTKYLSHKIEEERAQWAREKEELLHRQEFLERQLQQITLSRDQEDALETEPYSEFILEEKKDEIDGVFFVEDVVRPYGDLSRGPSFVKKVREPEVDAVSTGTTRWSLAGTFVIGKIQLRINYDQIDNRLKIFINRCKGLAPVHARSKSFDPYVKTYIMHGAAKLSKRKSSVKKNTCNPVYEETLEYELYFNDVETYTLRVSVWHKRPLLVGNRYLGEVIIPLEKSIIQWPIDDWFYLEKPLR